jgi:hypothetical protein
MNWRRVAVWLGVFALADVLLLLSPLPVPEDLLARVVPRAAVPLLALVAAGYGVKVIATAADEPSDRTSPVTAREDEGDVDRVGGDIDAAFDALAADNRTDWSRMNAKRVLRAELRRGTVEALTARGHDRETAEAMVDAGEWTDGRRAAAFLGEESLPLWMRVRDWASGEATRRQAEAAAEALADLTALASDAGTVRERPDRAPAGDLFGDALDDGAAGRTERVAELEPEVDA